MFLKSKCWCQRKEEFEIVFEDRYSKFSKIIKSAKIPHYMYYYLSLSASLPLLLRLNRWREKYALKRWLFKVTILQKCLLLANKERPEYFGQYRVPTFWVRTAKLRDSCMRLYFSPSWYVWGCIATSSRCPLINISCFLTQSYAFFDRSLWPNFLSCGQYASFVKTQLDQ